MNKNNIMINLNPKNANMNLEKLKVQKKLHEYQRLIDQKLNELIRNKHPHTKNNKYILNIRNSSPNIYINNFNGTQKKYNFNNKSGLGINYYLKKNQKKNLATNINTNNKNLNYKKLLSKSTIDSGKRNKMNSKNGNKNSNFLRNKNNSEYINNMKRNINKQSFSSKMDDSNSKKNDESIINKGKINLSLRKFIFAKCSNPTANTINNFH